MPAKTPSSNLVKVPSVIAMTCSFRLMRRNRSCDVSSQETAKGRRYHSELVSGRNAMEGLGDGKIWSAAVVRRPALPVGEIFRRTGCERRLRSQRFKRHAGMGLPKTVKGNHLAYSRRTLNRLGYAHWHSITSDSRRAPNDYERPRSARQSRSLVCRGCASGAGENYRERAMSERAAARIDPGILMGQGSGREAAADAAALRGQLLARFAATD